MLTGFGSGSIGKRLPDGILSSPEEAGSHPPPLKAAGPGSSPTCRSAQLLPRLQADPGKGAAPLSSIEEPQRPRGEESRVEVIRHAASVALREMYAVCSGALTATCDSPSRSKQLSCRSDSARGADLAFADF